MAEPLVWLEMFSQTATELCDEAIARIPWFEVALYGSAVLFLVEFYLDIRQIRQLGREDALPAEVAALLGGDEQAAVQRWSIARMKFLRFESAVGFALECLVLAFGLLRTVWDASMRVLGWLGFADHLVLRGTAFIFLVSLLSAVVRGPFEMARVVWVERGSRNFAEAREAVQEWFRDQATMAAISVACGLPMIAFSIQLLQSPFPYHWLLLSVLASLLGFFFSDIYPTYIAPLFNSFSPLPDGPLAVSLRELARQFRFPIKRIQVVDGSKRNSAQCNAFVSGFGRRKAIILYDTLIRVLEPGEILAVVAHELAHHKFNHTWKQLLCQLCFLGNFIFVFSRVIRSPRFFATFGFQHTDVAIAFVLFAYLYNQLSSLLLVLSNHISRGFEYTCDEEACRMRPDLPLERALMKLHAYNPAALAPDPWYSAYHYSHPSLLERLTRLAALRPQLAAAATAAGARPKED